ncbi:MAG: PASTA domain-containing protein [Clostridiales bacterium]|nr:PASTA domain-containing protein [Clostridiales bacterium]
MKSKNLASIILASALLLMTTSCAKELKESSKSASKEQPSDDTANPITQIEMPNVMGMHYKDATDLLKEKLKAAGYTDVTVSLGWAWGNGDMKKTFTIIGQEPAAGTLLDTSSSSICVIIYAQEYGIE